MNSLAQLLPYWPVSVLLLIVVLIVVGALTPKLPRSGKSNEEIVDEFEDELHRAVKRGEDSVQPALDAFDAKYSTPKRSASEFRS